MLNVYGYSRLVLRAFFALIFFVISASSVFAQPMTGTKTIPGDYATIEAAIAALNANGVGSGGVTFNVAGGHTETFSGPTVGRISATGTAANPIVFQKSGGGANPLITAGLNGTTTTLDGIIVLQGTDYITFDGIDVQENASNATATTQMEFGYALLKKNGTAPFDGCEYVTIKNCVITLNKTNTGTVGVNAQNYTALATTTLTITATTDANNNNTIDNVTVANAFYGMVFNGFAASTPYTLYDQNNTIKNCTIQNFGGSLTSYGVRGIYQNNFVVNSNNIDNMANGGAASGSTIYGIMMSTGTNSTFIARYNTIAINKGSNTSGMYGIYNSATGNIYICQNTLQNFVAGGSSGTCYFIQQAATLVAPYVAYMDSNTIGNSTSLNTTGTISAIYASTSTPTYYVRNNMISNITRLTAASGAFYGHYNGSSPTGSITVAYNTVKNITQGGTCSFYGVYNISSASSSWTMRKDSVYSITSGSGSTYGLYCGYSTTAYLDSNYISDIAGTGTVYGLATSSSVTTGYIYLNKVKALSSSGASSAVYGIQNTASSSGTIDCYRNNVYDLSSSGTGGLVYGISTGGGTNLRIYNNYVSDLRAPSSSSTTALDGLYLTAGTNVFAFYNTVFLNGSSSSGTFGSAALYGGSTTNLDLRNNVLVNLSTPGNGSAAAKTAAIRRSGLTTQATYYASASNANCLYAGTPDSSRVLYFDNSMFPAAQTISAYKAIVSPKDANSFTENPPFINVATTPYNLHMGTGTPTQTESGGVVVSSPIAVNTDFDGESRNGTTPDIGADEFIGTGLDLSAPVITYTVLGNTASTSVRNLAVTITDASGVPTSGAGLPVLYWRINTGLWSGVQATHGGGSTYNFSFGAGVVATDSVQYYIVAQDAAGTPNVGAYPSTGASGFTPNPPTAATPPTSPSQYKIVQSISGTFTVGALGDYTSIGAAITDINNKEVTGAVTLNLIDAYYDGETFPITVPQFAGVSATNTVTMKPAAATTVVIRGSNTGAIIKLNGADYFILDGSNSGGTTRDLTIINNNTTGAAVWIASLGANAGATYNTVKNCIFKAGSITATTTYGLVVSNTASLSTGGEDNDYNTIQNNHFLKSYYGLYVLGTSSNNAKNLTVQQNVVGSDTELDTLVIGKLGMYFSYVNNSTITRNTVQNMASVTVINTPAACSLSTGVLNTTFTRNDIHNIRYTGTGGYGAWGLYVSTGNASSGLTIANNIIYNIMGDGWSTYSGSSMVGMYLDGTTGGVNVYYNSVNMYGSFSRTTGTLTTAFLLNTGTITNLDVRNNVFANSLNNTGSTGTPKSYAIYSTSANTAFTQINYNDYYVSGTQGVLGYLGADQATLAAWQTATGKDGNSLNADPQFNSNTNLIPQGTSPLLAAGTPVSVTTDYLGTTRSVTTPTIGAYEGAVDISGPTITFTDLGNTTSTSNRSFTNVTITDPSGVNGTSGTSPRVYYKRSTDANAWNDNTSGTDGWKWVEAAGSSSPFSFTIDYSKLNGGTGVAQGNTVQYFVVAQDNQGSPYVSIQSGSFAATPSSVALTGAAFPIAGTIKSYAISVAVSGTVTVGSGGNYATLTGAGGLFNTLNNGVVTGNVTVNIISDLTEDGANALNAWAEEPVSSNFTVSIHPSAAVTRTISGTYAGGLIRLNGADRVTIDGRYSGSGNYLTFSNASTGTSAVLQFASLGTGLGATNNTVRNCTFIGGSATTTGVYGIFSGSATVGTGQGDNNDNTFLNNVVKKAYYGLYLLGTSTLTQNNWTVQGNTVGGDVSTDYVGKYGIYTSYLTGATITQNTVYNQISTITNPSGIYLAANTLNSSVTRNDVHGIAYTSTSGYGGKGIDLNTGNATSSVLVANNVIYNIYGDGYSGTTDNICGIRIGSGGGYNIYYNSVNLYGSISRSSATVDISGALFITSTATSLDIRDNVFANAIENTTGVATAYAVYSAAANTAFTTINYNNYYASGVEGVLGYLGANQADITAWRTASAQDANSISAAPQFIANTNLQPMAASPLLAAGTPVSVTNDYLGITRSVTTPSIGAYENSTDAPVIAYTALANTTSTSNVTLTGVSITTTNIPVNFSTAKPRIYFKKLTDNNVFGGNTSTDNGWKWTETASTSSPAAFTIDYSIINGGSVTGGDRVQYFVVAQNTATTPEVTANPSTGFAGTSVSSITAAPASPNSYKIVGAALTAGTYTVGTAKFNQVTGRNIVHQQLTRTVDRPVYVPVAPKSDKPVAPQARIEKMNSPAYAIPEGDFEVVYTPAEETYSVLYENGAPYTGPNYVSLKDAETTRKPVEGGESVEGVYTTLTAAVTDLNERGIAGPVVFSLVDATYPSETFPVTINVTAAGVPTASNTVIIKPASGISPTISGAAASLAILRVTNTNYITIDGSNTLNGTTRDLTIANTSATTPNVLVIGSVGTTPVTNITVKNCNLTNGVNTSTGLIIGDATTVGNAGYFSAITIQNNNLKKTYHGMYIRGGDAGVSNGSDLVVQGNSIEGTSTDAFGSSGIYVQGVNHATVSGNVIGNGTSSTGNLRGIWFATGTSISTASGNKVYNLTYTGTGGYGAHGMDITPGLSPADITVVNNMFSGMTGDGYNSTTLSDNPSGLYINGTQTGINIYFNSIYLSGNTINYGTSAASYGVACGAGSTIDLRNNIIVNNLGLLSATGLGSIGVYLSTANTQLTQSNYNNYYVSPSGSGIKVIGSIAGVTSAGIGEWRTATAKDANSASAAMNFTSASDLHLTGPSIGDKNLIGMPGLGFTTDFDGQVRNAYAPYMGADEIPASLLALGLNLTAYIEGFYTPALEAQVADTMKVYLRSGTNLAKVDSATAVLNTSGAGTFVFKGSSKVDSTYYLVLTHRNSIETWSAAAQTFPSGERNYNFTTSASQAFGSNMSLKGSAYCMYSGDVNQDGIVDFSDLVLIDNDQFNFVGGYVVTDITGDDFVDFSDLSLCDNNQFNFISVISPATAKRPVNVRSIDAKPVINSSIQQSKGE